MGADATEASAANPGRELLTEMESGNVSLCSELKLLPMLLSSGSVGENGLVVSVPVEGSAAEVSTDGVSKRELPGVWCADDAGFKAGSRVDAR